MQQLIPREMVLQVLPILASGGPYTIAISLNSCTYTCAGKFFISWVGPIGLVGTPIITPQTCEGLNDGTISVMVTGGFWIIHWFII